MSKTFEKILLFLLDLITVNAAFLLWSRIRERMGFFSETSFWGGLSISLIIFFFWLMLFIFYGQYRTVFTRSRTDEFLNVVKSVTAGVIVIFLMTFDLQQDVSKPFAISRLMIITYWGLMVVLVGFGRVLLRTIQRRLLIVGIGRRRAVIIGWGEKAKELCDLVHESPALGYEIAGFVVPDKPQRGQYKGLQIRCRIAQLNRLIKKESIQEVLIALSRRSERRLQEVIQQCDGTPVGIKIVPDLYDVIIGQVRTNQIYGFPLIEIMPQFMAPWEMVIKRFGDIVFSLVVLIGFLPVWIMLAAFILIETSGGVFYVQTRVGKDGKIFKMIKFRSMMKSAEKTTGPVWASSHDPRVTRIGRMMRRLRLDEIPQLINILAGDMSLVGPRPERPYFVEQLKKHFPLYTRRLRVRPGLTGWAQVKGEYDQSLEHVKKKLEYDLFYLENCSLRMDLKIILNTLYVMLRGKGH